MLPLNSQEEVFLPATCQAGVRGLALTGDGATCLSAAEESLPTAACL